MRANRFVTTAGLAALLLLAGCAEGGQADETEAGPTLPSTSSAAPSSSEPAEPTGPVRNERGNVEKALGEEGGISDLATDQPVITFTVDAIGPAQCTSDYAQYGSGPENGNLVAVNLRFSTAPELAASALGSYFTVSAYDFRFIGPDGITQSNLGTAASYGCLSQNQQFTQNPLGSGQQYVGSIVLDLPATNGTLVYAPSVIAEGGWEWQF